MGIRERKGERKKRLVEHPFWANNVHVAFHLPSHFIFSVTTTMG